METISLQILNPKVKAILQNLSDLDLIRFDTENANIKVQAGEKIAKIEESIQENNEEPIPTMEEIVAIVKEVRKERYESRN